jgi:hypothetical protein
MAKNFEKLVFGGLHEKHAVQRGIMSLTCPLPRRIVPTRTAQETSPPVLFVLSLLEKQRFHSNGCCSVACLHTNWNITPCNSKIISTFRRIFPSSPSG